MYKIIQNYYFMENESCIANASFTRKELRAHDDVEFLI
jgi:hypothetical protein